jgi:hypothetical protein
VQSGFTTLEEDCGKSTGIMEPGAQFCYCCWKRIACCLTTSQINYNAPVMACPTRDNSYVGVDVHFSLQLPTNEVQVKKFVYELGVARFDELLYAICDESIRSYINTVWLAQIRDIKEEMTVKMQMSLNETFQQFGVQFRNINITHVKLNQ